MKPRKVLKKVLLIKFYTLFFISYLLVYCDKETSTNISASDPETEDYFEFVLYDNLSHAEVNNVLNALSVNYERILNDLNIEELPVITVKIWQNYDNFLNVMQSDLGTRYQGATGYVYGSREIRIFFNNETPTTAVHEFAHVVTMYVNPTIPNNPRWLWEAVALYETRQFFDPANLYDIVNGNYPTVEDLNADYNSGRDIYSIGYVLMEYIVETWGRQAMINLISTNGNIQSVLEITVDQFESGWYNYIENKYLKD